MPKKSMDQYSKIMKSCLLIPFKHNRMFSKSPPMPIILSRLLLSVVETESNVLFTIRLQYGEYTWEIIRNIVTIFTLKAAIELLGIRLRHINKRRLITNDRHSEIQLFLNDVLDKVENEEIHELHKFLEISSISFIGPKIFDYPMNVKIQEIDEAHCCCGSDGIISYEEKFISLKSNFIAIIDCKTNKIENILFISYDSRLSVENMALSRRLVIFLSSKVIKITSHHLNHIETLHEKLKDYLNSVNTSEISSFAPSNYLSTVDFIVDARSYFSEIYKSFKAATDEIFIAGWWIYPNLYLKRRFKHGKLRKKYRLSNILRTKAKEGVKIYILVFKENTIALPNDSSYTEQVLGNIHKNITVIRHPLFKAVGFTYWSHHDKIVVVDQRISYLGGLDLALGRYDDFDHKLFDQQKSPGNEEKHSKNEKRKRDATSNNTFSGTNSMVGNKSNSDLLIMPDMWDVDNQKTESSDTHRQPEEPIHHQSPPGNKSNNHMLVETLVGSTYPGEVQYADGSFWPGMDFSNPLKRDFTIDFEDEMAEIIDRKGVPRMPWHDVHCKITGRSSYDITCHFIERWNFALKNVDIKKDLLVPRLEQQNTITHLKTQVIRSLSYWSGGIGTENSIEIAYIFLITNAQKFIYIENQFLITKIDEESTEGPRNRIGRAIVNRIKRAYLENEEFKVYIILPLMPAFEANFENNYASSLKRVIKIQNDSIIGKQHSMSEVLKKDGINLFDYMLFLSLNKYQLYQGQAFQEEIYIHSKILIADGKRAVVGSANLNDRSLLGHRDSEISILVDETRDGEKVENLLKQLLQEHWNIDIKNKLATTDRYVESLWKLFLEREWIYLESKRVFDIFKNVAYKNTTAFRNVFRTIPDNSIESIRDLNRFKCIKGLAFQKDSTELVQSELMKIQGRVVIYPYNFLCKEVFINKIISTDSLVSDIVYH